jgi:hypothetical protein
MYLIGQQLRCEQWAWQFPTIFKPKVPALGLLYPPLSVRPLPSRPKSQFNYITIDFVIKHNQLT